MNESNNRRPSANQKKHRVRRAIPYAAAVLLIVLIILGLRPRPVRVETVQAQRGPLRATVTEEGKTRIRHRYVVAAPLAGQLRRIELKAGADVQAGQTVAVIEPVVPGLLDARTRQLAEARRDAAQANLARARAAHQFAAAELARVRQLHKEGAASVRDLDAAVANETVAAKEVMAAEGSLAAAEAELANFTAAQAGSTNAPAVVEVKAPVSGSVLRVFEESARVVPMGAPLLEVGDPADLEVEIEVLSRDGAIIAPGMKIELEQWGNGQPLEAVVRLVEPQAFTKISALGVEEQRVRVIADLATPPAQRPGLGDQFRVEARIITWQTDQTLKVPAGALFRRGEQWYGFVLENERAQLRPVQVGRASDTELQVLEGLQPGERLILYPGDRVQVGTRVQPLQVQ